MNVLDVLARELASAEGTGVVMQWHEKVAKCLLNAMRGTEPGALVITEEGELARLVLDEAHETFCDHDGYCHENNCDLSRPLYRLVPVGGETQ